MLHVEQTVPRRVVGALDARGDSLAVAGVDAFEVRRQRYGFLGAPAVDHPHFRRPVKGVGDVVVVENTDMGNADRLPQPLFAFAQGCFHALPLGDIRHRAVHPIWLARLAVEEPAPAKDPMLASVRPDDAELVRKDATRVARRVHITIYLGQIVRTDVFCKGLICPSETSGLITEHAFGLSVTDDLSRLEVPIERTQCRGLHCQLQAAFTGGERRLRLAPPLHTIKVLQAECHVERDLLQQLHLIGTERARLESVNAE